MRTNLHLLTTVSVATLLATAPADAQDATWLAAPSSGNFNAPANWTPATVPTGTASFGASNITSLSFSADTTVGGWTFNPGASAYTFTNGQTLVFNGAGIVINGGSAAITNNSNLNFLQNSTAGGAAITNNSALVFTDSSTAGNATITTANGALTRIDASATGGQARFITAAGGTFNIANAVGGPVTAGSIEGAGSHVLGGNQLTTGFNNASTTVSGPISGAGGSLFKVGTGTLTLSGASSYTGLTNVIGGTLQAGAANAFAPQSAFFVNGGAKLDLNNFSQTVGSLGDSGDITLGSGTLTTGGNNASTTYGGEIEGTGGLTKVGTGTMVLTNQNIYTGATNLNGGTLQAGAVGAFAPQSAFTVANGTTLDLNGFNQTVASLAGAGQTRLGSAALTTGGNNNNTIYSGVISGAGGSLIKNGTGTMTLAAQNTYSGGTTLNNGALVVGNNQALGTGGLTVNGGTLAMSGFTSTVSSLAGSGGVIDLSSNSSLIVDQAADTSFGGRITATGAGQFQKRGFGALTLNGVVDGPIGVTVANGALILNGVNSYAGPTLVDFGATVRAMNNQSVGSGAIQLNGGTFQAGAAGLSFSNAIQLTGLSSIDTQGFNLALTGAISNPAPGGLNKHGTGTLTLFGPSSYIGATNVNQGTLQAGAANVFSPFSAFTVRGGAKLDLNNFNQTIGPLSGFGDINLGSAQLSTGDDTSITTYSGEIQGTGSLVKTGASTLILGNQNTYTGGTTVTDGAIQLAAQMALGPGSLNLNGTFTLGGFNQLISSLSGDGLIDLTGNSFLQIQQNSNTTFDGQITSNDGGIFTKAGTGTLTLNAVVSGGLVVLVEGGGTIVLNGANFHSGGTSITGATAVVTNNSSVGTGTVAVTSGTFQAGQPGLTFANPFSLSGPSVIDTQGFNLALTGAISDSGDPVAPGQLVKIGTGMLTLSGPSTYPGLTNVNQGTLQAGAANVFAPISPFNIAAGATLDLNNFNQTIGGLGGAGNVNLGSATLTTGGGGLVSIFSGVISGSGGLTKVGSRAFALTGNNTYTGPTNVNAGLLAVGGSIASSAVTVSSGAGLTGPGTVGSTTVLSGGTFTPGTATAPGTSTNVNGNLTTAAGSNFVVNANGSTSTFANVSGNAIIDGTVTANWNSFSLASQYTIVNSAGGLTSVPGPLVNTNLPPGFTTTLSADATHVYINVSLSLPGGGTTTGTGTVIPHPPGQPLPPPNARAVAVLAVNHFERSGTIPIAFGAATTVQGLNQLSGEGTVGTQQTTFVAMGQFMNALLDPFLAERGVTAPFDSRFQFAADDAPTSEAPGERRLSNSERDAYAAVNKAVPPRTVFERRWSVWAAGYGGSETTDGSALDGTSKLTSRIYGIAAGADYRLSPNTQFGFALGGAGTSFSVAGLGSGSSDMFQAGVFGRHTMGAAYVAGALAYGWQDITTTRTVTIAGTDVLRANFDANALSGRLEGGYRFATSFAGITPYAAGQFTTFFLPSYSEQNIGGLNPIGLTYAATDETVARSELGARLDRSFLMPDAILTVRGRAAWAHNFNTDRSITPTFQALPGAGSFSIIGAELASDSALASAAVEVRWANGISIAASFDGEFSDVTRSYAGKGFFRYQW